MGLLRAFVTKGVGATTTMAFDHSSISRAFDTFAISCTHTLWIVVYVGSFSWISIGWNAIGLAHVPCRVATVVDNTLYRRAVSMHVHYVPVDHEIATHFNAIDAIPNPGRRSDDILQPMWRR